MVQIVAFLREKCRLKRLQTAFCLRFGQKSPGTALAFLYAPRRPAGLPLSLLQIGLRVQVGKMPVKFESDRPRPLLLQPAPQCFHPRKQIGNRALQNLRADVHNVVVHRYRRFHIKRVAQRCAFRHGFKPSHQIVRQVRHIARHNQQPIGRRQLQISLAAVHKAESGPKCRHCRASGKMWGLRRAYSSKFRLVLMAIWPTCGLILPITWSISGLPSKRASPLSSPPIRSARPPAKINAKVFNAGGLWGKFEVFIVFQSDVFDILEARLKTAPYKFHVI